MVGKPQRAPRHAEPQPLGDKIVKMLGDAAVMVLAIAILVMINVAATWALTKVDGTDKRVVTVGVGIGEVIAFADLLIPRGLTTLEEIVELVMEIGVTTARGIRRIIRTFRGKR
jgi:hypothetical protein